MSIVRSHYTEYSGPYLGAPWYMANLLKCALPGCLTGMEDHPGKRGVRGPSPGKLLKF